MTRKDPPNGPVKGLLLHGGTSATAVKYDLKDGVPGVRVATPADEDQIFALLMAQHAEMAHYSFNPQKVREGIQVGTRRQGGIIGVIRDGPDNKGPNIVASIGISLTTEWYSDDPYLCERWNYVHSDHRRSDYARRLLEFGKWAHAWWKHNAKMNVPFQCGINSLDRTEAKVRLYSRHMVCIGAYFMYGEPPRKMAQPPFREAQAQVIAAEQSKKPLPIVKTIIELSRRAPETVA